MSDVVSAKPGWLWFAVGAAIFAAATTLLGKIGVKEVNSNVATFIRVIVMLVVTVGLISCRQEWQGLSGISTRNWVVIVASGLATGLSWLCYFYALQLAPASQVAPVDKLSVALVMVVGIAALGEPFTWQIALGGILIVGGVLLVTWGGG